MKVAISSMGDSLDAPLDPRFGRCAYLIFTDPDTGELTAIANDAAAESGGGGVKVATTVAENGARVAISGSFGPKAARVLTAGGVETYTTSATTVRSALEEWRQLSE
jgi:predicted Fe-Mo cluster-binding NifX family protein